MSGITISKVSKVFQGGVKAVDEVSLSVEEGEFMVLVGPSGCGKTTLLRMIAGLENVTAGTISIADRPVTHLPAGKRDIAMVFQNYALYPHMSVRANLGYGLRVRRTPRAETRARVQDIARLLGLEELLDRRPGALSGGQRQRVAIGRAIVREPAAFLMDEPLSNLDAKLRAGMRGELARLHERLGRTTVYVTHDQVEAMTLGTRVAVMHAGSIQQVDRPQELYRNPKNMFVAAFIGSPTMNLVEGQLKRDAVQFGGHALPLPEGRRPRARSDQVVVGIRPECFADADFGDPRLPQIEVSVNRVEELGATTEAMFTLDEERLELEGVGAPDDDGMLLADDHRAHFTAKLDPRTTAAVGRRLRLCVDTARIHFFDPETGANIDGTPGVA